VSFEFGEENNNTIDAISYGKLTVKLPLGNKQKFTNFAIVNKAFKDSHKMDLGFCSPPLVQITITSLIAYTCYTVTISIGTNRCCPKVSIKPNSVWWVR
jgi:hypothetical protein